MSKIYRLKRSDIFGRFCVRIDIWWWWWRFWWSDATRLLELTAPRVRLTQWPIWSKQNAKKTPKQKYEKTKIQNTKHKMQIQNTDCKKMSKITHLKKSGFWDFFGIFNIFEKLWCQFIFSFFNFFQFFLHSNTHWYLVVLGRTKNQTLFWASFQEVGFFGDFWIGFFSGFQPKNDVSVERL